MTTSWSWSITIPCRDKRHTMGWETICCTCPLALVQRHPIRHSPSSDNTYPFNQPHSLRWMPRRSFTYPVPCFPPIPFNFVRHRSPRGSPLPNKGPIQSHVDWVCRPRLRYSHLHL